MSPPPVDETGTRPPDAALDASAHLAAMLLDSAPDGIVVADRNGTISLVNRRIEELFGYERAALVGGRVEILLPEDGRRRHMGHRESYVAEPRLRPMGGDLDLWAQRADGARFPVEVSLAPLESDGELLVIATVRDISARRAAEQRMRNMSHLLGGIDEAVFLADVDTLEVTYVNTAGCVLGGYDEGELLGRSLLWLLPGVEPNVVRELLRRPDRDERRRVVTTEMHTRTGMHIPVECAIDVPPVLRGQPAQLCVLVRDITERLQREAVVRTADALATLIDDRERIAADLHETVIPDLFAAGLSLQSTATRLDGELRERILDAVDRHDAIIRSIRTTVFQLTERRDQTPRSGNAAPEPPDRRAR